MVALAGTALAALLLTGVLVAGCGDDGSSDANAGETTSTTAAASTTSTAAPATSASAAPATTETTAASLSASLNGAGATFPEPLYVEWIGEFQTANSDVTINYQGIGSGGGIEQFTKLTVDFGASDAPMKDEEIAAAEAAGGAKVLHIPTVFGAVAVAFNLDGVEELKLDSDTLAAIFLGDVTTWNDPMITALNNAVVLPDEAIQVVHRSDSSGTTSIFTGYLNEVSASWADRVGKGKEVEWPVGVGGQGNDGVAAVVQQQAGSIGYMELSYALESGIDMATLKNRSGSFITPSLESTSAAAVGVEFPEDLRFSVSNSDGAQAYPIAGATWILAFDKMQDPAKMEALKAWLTWALSEGTSIAEELNYAPLSDGLKAKAMEKVESISAM
ncbi:MAG: phosphate ABC transporter substrate-binding protein PstS [Thermoleophilia bacterium]|nr:phosphate ABC transporter substrate-binding protein PstS [Thermoleophilia bacterium]